MLELISPSIAALQKIQGISAHSFVTAVTHIEVAMCVSGVRVSPPSYERVPVFFLAHSGLGRLLLGPLGAHSGLGRSKKRPLGAHSGLGPQIFGHSDSNSHSDFSDVRVPPAVMSHSPPRCTQAIRTAPRLTVCAARPRLLERALFSLCGYTYFVQLRLDSKTQ